MKLELHHCLLLILLAVLCHGLVTATPSSKGDGVTDDPTDNCTREDGVLICPCNTIINGTYYPCWTPVNNATAPTNNTGNDTCFACPAGSFSNSKLPDNNCSILCGDGSCIAPFKCVLCSKGSFAAHPNSTSCEPCPKGYYSNAEGQADCTACTPGSTSDSARESCIPCLPGYYSIRGGTCDPCSPGTYSKGQADTCLKCPKGTYNSNPAQSADGCKPCGPGYYGQEIGSTSRSQCLECPAGSYCPDVATDYPKTCPKNNYCVKGSSSPTPCSFLYQADVGTEDCKPSVGFYLLIFGSAAMAAIAFLIVWRWRVAKQERLRREYHSTEIDRLIPKPRGGPVYRGL